VLELWDGIRKSDKQFIHSHEFASNQPQVGKYNVGAPLVLGQATRDLELTHKTHHGPDSGEGTTFPHIVYFAPLYEAHIQMAFCLGTPKWESQNY